jgi:hypothetical protein
MIEFRRLILNFGRLQVAKVAPGGARGALASRIPTLRSLFGTDSGAGGGSVDTAAGAAAAFAGVAAIATPTSGAVADEGRGGRSGPPGPPPRVAAPAGAASAGPTSLRPPPPAPPPATSRPALLLGNDLSLDAGDLGSPAEDDLEVLDAAAMRAAAIAAAANRRPPDVGIGLLGSSWLSTITEGDEGGEGDGDFSRPPSLPHSPLPAVRQSSFSRLSVDSNGSGGTPAAGPATRAVTNPLNAAAPATGGSGGSGDGGTASASASSALRIHPISAAAASAAARFPATPPNLTSSPDVAAFSALRMASALEEARDRSAAAGRRSDGADGKTTPAAGAGGLTGGARGSRVSALGAGYHPGGQGGPKPASRIVVASAGPADSGAVVELAPMSAADANGGSRVPGRSPRALAHEDGVWAKLGAAVTAGLSTASTADGYGVPGSRASRRMLPPGVGEATLQGRAMLVLRSVWATVFFDAIVLLNTIAVIVEVGARMSAWQRVGGAGGEWGGGAWGTVRFCAVAASHAPTLARASGGRS